MTVDGWDLRLLGALVIAVVVYIGVWVWAEMRAEAEETRHVQGRCRTPEPAPRLRVLPGGER